VSFHLFVGSLKEWFNRRAIILLTIFAVMAVFLTACAGQSGTVSGSDSAATSDQSSANPTLASGGSSSGSVSFAKDVEPIFQSRCVNCHGGQQTQRGLNLTQYSSVMTGSVNGAVVVPGNPDSSTLIQMVVQGKMPKRGPQLLPGQVQILTDWVKAGAPNN
jgi:uncharacterized membrane protein